MSRFIGVFCLVTAPLIAMATLGLAAPAASAAPAPVKFNADLAALWTTVFETPSAQNSFGTGGAAFGCWNLGSRTVAPFGPSGIDSCTVKPGTKIFIGAAKKQPDGTLQAARINYGKDGITPPM